jgi:hypothetical protein
MFGIFKKKKQCDHTQNYYCEQYLSDNGTPMIHFVCKDCSYIDQGHVHGDSEDWVKDIEVRNGVRIK